VIEETKAHVGRRQALTYEEMEAEREEVKMKISMKTSLQRGFVL
jgi:hypothetical protein